MTCQLPTDPTVAEAVAQDELRLLYQPIVRIADRAVVAVEALVRWQHPVRGLITPDQFLPAGHEAGHLPLLDRWVLDQACRDMASLRDAVHRPAHVNVNLSAQTLATDFTELVTAALDHNGLCARRLQLELSEGADLATLTRAGPRLSRLIERGVAVAIDDMGTGATDLRYLSRLAVHGIKIDKEFVAGMLHNPRDHAIVTLLTSLGHSLRLHVTAEGVESAEQLAALARLGVSNVQGYHLAPPLALTELTRTVLAG
ncbi:EAL domain-containing protein [Asanoa sp. WMMD1127]|uniref:EAL domain-containing protein n=1 Tax=Asanoa sp. WMMD1127 TaxID=3016107 RepID=UPI0024180C5B|nr:EAL domain-containing protein [Asanoa sp. WMMD1127]MDG4824614.1 EAL domain-containing protein [Asanoa sp. WMMD1127]